MTIEEVLNIATLGSMPIIDFYFIVNMFNVSDEMRSDIDALVVSEINLDVRKYKD